MTDPHCPGKFDGARRRKLDELFADEPFLSATMRASRLHDRLVDEPVPRAIQMVAPLTMDEPLGRLSGEERRRQLLAGLEGEAVAVRPRAAAPVAIPVRVPLPAPRSGPGSSPAQFRIDLVVDMSGGTPKVSAAAPAPDVLTVQEVAELLRVSPATIRAWAASRRIPCFRAGRRLRFRRDAVLAALES